MSMIEGILAEFEHEATNTRKLLERVPNDRLAWKPHSKSWDLAHLAGHVAQIPSWGSAILIADHFDLARTEGEESPPVPSSRKEILTSFETSLETFRSVLKGLSPEALTAPWQLRRGTEVVTEMPRIACLRSFILNHIVHHRGQLTVYLRLLDIPVPGIYGPSADEARL